MRNLILKKIKELKREADGFRKGVTRWDILSLNMKNTSNEWKKNDHVSDIDFNEMKDEELLNNYNKIIFTYYKQM